MDTKAEVKKQPDAVPETATASPEAETPETVDKLQMILDALMDIKAMLMEEEDVELSEKPMAKEMENVTSKVPPKAKLPETPEEKEGFAKTEIKRAVEEVMKDMGVKVVGGTPKPVMDTVAKVEEKPESGMSILDMVRKGEDLARIGRGLTEKAVESNKKLYEEVFRK